MTTIFVSVPDDRSKTVSVRSMSEMTSSLPIIRSKERVVWLTDEEGPLYGTVKWTGKISGEWHAGVDFVSLQPLIHNIRVFWV